MDPTRPHQTLIRPIHIELTINEILPKSTKVHYNTITDASSGYHNLTLDKKSVILNHICMSASQVKIHQTTISNGANR